MNTGGTPSRFQHFVAMRRKWFGIVFVAALLLCGIGLRDKCHSLVGHRQANLTLLWVCLVANVLYLVPNSPMFAGMRSEWCMIAALAGMLLWKLTSDFRQRRPGKMHERTN